MCRIFASFVLAGLVSFTNMNVGLAADLPVKAPTTVAPAVATLSWTGWYAGVNVGGAWGESRNIFIADFPPPTAAGADTTHFNGVIGGGQVGYNYQLGRLVLGLESDLQSSGQRSSNNTSCTIAGCIVPGSTIADTEKLTWFGTTRARVGIASGGWLAYATGGVAYGRISSAGITTLPGIGSIPVSASSTKGGWTAGGGVEVLLSGNWTGKLEYLYMDLGNVSASVPDPFIPGATAGGSSHFTENILRAGVNLRF
jgi:outer membrane immunogenic protein